VSDSALRLLARVPLFTGLEPAALEILAGGAQGRAFEADEVVFFEGEVSEGLYVVASGWLKGSKVSAAGREQVLRYFGAGEAINEVGLFVETTNPATLIALEPSRVWLIPRRAILTLVAQQPGLLWPLTQNLARRLLEVVRLVEDLSLLPLEARLAKYLLEHAAGDVFERRRWATQAELAARLGTVPDVLNRILRGFADEGLVAVERQRIVILDRAGLEARTHPS
jgi:CRP-like cAMP-binding protein